MNHKVGNVPERTGLVRFLVSHPLLLSQGRGVLCLDRPLRHVGSQACPQKNTPKPQTSSYYKP